MAEEKDFFQKLSGEMLDFFDHVGDTLGDPLARDAVIRDLGGKASPLTCRPRRPSRPTSSTLSRPIVMHRTRRRKQRSVQLPTSLSFST